MNDDQLLGAETQLVNGDEAASSDNQSQPVTQLSVPLPPDQAIHADNQTMFGTVSNTDTSTKVALMPESTKTQLIKFAKFSLISLVVGALPFMLAPGFTLGFFNLQVVRTCIVIAFTWNLIGAALFARTRGRVGRLVEIAIFATPLALTYGWICAGLAILKWLHNFNWN